MLEDTSYRLITSFVIARTSCLLPPAQDTDFYKSFYRDVDKSLALPWKETSYSDQDLQHYTKTYGTQTKYIYLCCLYAVSLGIFMLFVRLSLRIFMLFVRRKSSYIYVVCTP